MCWFPRTNVYSYRVILQQQLQPCHLYRFVVSEALNGGMLIDSLVSCPSIDPRKHCRVQLSNNIVSLLHLFGLLCRSAECLGVFVDSDVCGLVYWNATKWIVISKLGRESPIGEVLVNLWIVSMEVDHLRIVCWQISCIIQSVIGKVPWKHFPDGKQVQLPITTS